MDMQLRHGAVTALLLLSVLCLSLAMIGCKGKPDGKKPPTAAELAAQQRVAGQPAAAAKTAGEAQALRDSFLEQHKLKGKVSLVEFGAIGCKLSEKGLEEMAFLHGVEEMPGLCYVRVEAMKDTAAVEKYYKA
jgi:hypothetical protein